MPIFKYKAAPKAAPLETPNVKGVAKAFLNIAWNAIPLTAKADPTVKANNILGTRIFQNILYADSFSWLFKTDVIDIFSIPQNGANDIRTIEKRENPMSLCFIFFNLLPPAE